MEFELNAKFKDGVEEFLFGIGFLMMDDDFFDYLEDQTAFEGGNMDIGLFAYYADEWEKQLR